MPPILIELSSNTTQPDYAIRICVPGNFTQTPWSRSGDAVTIREEIYLGVAYRNASDSESLASGYGGSFGTHCTMNTTRGYFELGNAFHGFIPQALFQKFPESGSLEEYNRDLGQP